MRASEMTGASGMASVLTPMRREHAMNSSAAAPRAGTRPTISGVAAVDPSTAPSMSESPSPHSPPARRTAAPSAQVTAMPAAVSAAPARLGQKAATDEETSTARCGMGTIRKRMSLAAMASELTAATAATGEYAAPANAAARYAGTQ